MSFDNFDFHIDEDFLASLDIIESNNSNNEPLTVQELSSERFPELTHDEVDYCSRKLAAETHRDQQKHG